MREFLEKIKLKAREKPMSIVFPEALVDERIVQAVQLLVIDKTAKVKLLGERQALSELCGKYDLKENDFLEFVDFSKKKRFAESYFELRRHKLQNLAEAEAKMSDINYYGTMLVKMGYCDAMISGTTFSTAETIRPALELLVTKDDFARVSGFFFLIVEEKVFIFADCAVNIDPSPEDLAGIALDTARSAKDFGLIPKVAMLSFSTQQSAMNPLVEKVRLATELVRAKDKNLLIDGEIQVDAAMVPVVAMKKAPNSPIQGDANVLIFPGLESGNISYKLVERLAKAKALGPILQGLDKPINDLSRGCSVLDIVNIAAITSYQAQKLCTT